MLIFGGTLRPDSTVGACQRIRGVGLPVNDPAGREQEKISIRLPDLRLKAVASEIIRKSSNSTTPQEYLRGAEKRKTSIHIS